MSKRAHGVGKNKKSHSHKTAKRLEIKKVMLEKRASKRGVQKSSKKSK